MPSTGRRPSWQLQQPRDRPGRGPSRRGGTAPPPPCRPRCASPGTPPLFSSHPPPGAGKARRGGEKGMRGRGRGGQRERERGEARKGRAGKEAREGSRDSPATEDCPLLPSKRPSPGTATGAAAAADCWVPVTGPAMPGCVPRPARWPGRPPPQPRPADALHRRGGRHPPPRMGAGGRSGGRGHWAGSSAVVALSEGTPRAQHDGGAGRRGGEERRQRVRSQAARAMWVGQRREGDGRAARWHRRREVNGGSGCIRRRTRRCWRWRGGPRCRGTRHQELNRSGCNNAVWRHASIHERISRCT